MTALDIFVLLLLGGGALVGFVRGFTYEVISLAAWVVGIAARSRVRVRLPQSRTSDARFIRQRATLFARSI